MLPLDVASSLCWYRYGCFYACPGGACIGIGSKTGRAPPLTVLLGDLQGQIILSEPL